MSAAQGLGCVSERRREPQCTTTCTTSGVVNFWARVAEGGSLYLRAVSVRRGDLVGRRGLQWGYRRPGGVRRRLLALPDAAGELPATGGLVGPANRWVEDASAQSFVSAMFSENPAQMRCCSISSPMVSRACLSTEMVTVAMSSVGGA